MGVAVLAAGTVTLAAFPAAAHTTAGASHTGGVCPYPPAPPDSEQFCPYETLDGGTGSGIFVAYKTSSPTPSGSTWLAVKWTSTGTLWPEGIGLCVRYRQILGFPNNDGPLLYKFTTAGSSSRTAPSYAQIGTGTDPARLYASDGTEVYRPEWWWYQASSSCATNDPGPPATAGITVEPPAVSASRRLEQAGTDGIAYFTASATPADGRTETYSWDFGDGSAASSARSPKHLYGALTAQPESGWVATLTVTSTLAMGYQWPDGTNAPKSQQVRLLVDFFNPQDSTPDSADDPEEDQTAEACKPSGWGWLNPLQYVRSTVCVLKALFIPTTPLSDHWQALSDSASGNYPLGPVIWAASTAADGWRSFTGMIEHPAMDCAWGPTFPIPGLEDGAHIRLGEALCANTQITAFHAIRPISRVLTAAAFVMGAVLFVLRLGGWLAGGSPPVPGGEAS